MSNSAHTTHNNALASHEASWRERFGQVVPIVLPYTKQVVSSERPDGRRVSLVLPDAMLALCQQSSVGLSEWLLAAFGAYLARLCRVTSFDVGVRDHLAAQSGQNTPYLPLHIDVGGVERFDGLLERVQREVNGLTTVGLASELPEQEAWSVAVDLAPTPSASPNNRGGAGGGGQADFTMRITEREGVCEWLYNAQVLDEAHVRTMQGQFLRVLEGIAANPSIPLSELRLLSDSERHQLLVEFNDTAADYVPNRCLHELFEQQVARTPDAQALVWGTERLSYQQLNEKANQLAHYLRELGVGHGVLVGISVARSVEMVVGLLAILKAGGAYVPLDPAYPQERLSFIIEDTQAPVLLTQAALLEELPANTRNRTVICLDRDWHFIAQASNQNPVSEVTSDHLGYVIYTSGSTGRPKGVAIEHRSAVTLVDWALAFFAPLRQAQGPRLLRGTLFSTSICFDLSVFELFVPLSCGGKVILAENALQLPSLPAANEVTLINTVPSAMAALVRLNAIPRSVEAVILAGEPLKTSLVAQIYEHQHIRYVFDLYGPSEDTTYSTHALRHATGRATIGRPIANTQLYLLDHFMQPVPLGVPGQIYLGGAGLARGYLKRPDLTAERFIPNPFAAQAGTRLGTRLYNTGDLARYRPDGNLEFLGRVDHQVKIRGYRIELGEIEAALMRHPAIRENVVVASEMPNGDKRLVAYVVAESSDTGMFKAQDEQITQWQTVWDGTYREQDAKTLFHSWNSSYDKQPIPEREMQEWLDYIVERVFSLQPKRVLELGCGTGLLLFEIAPYMLEYWASDFSEVSLTYIKEQIDEFERDLPQVKLFQQEARDFTLFEQEKFDLILINSVVQYFPTMAYLVNVLEQAVEVLEPGGAILLGDVRHLGLLDAFHTSVAWHNAPDSLTREEFKKDIQETCAKEEELLIDPPFFTALQAHLPQITHVEINMKHGRAHNELTRFRYDVLLRVRGSAHPHKTATTDGMTLDWQQNQLSLANLHEILRDEEPSSLSIKNVPNSRLMTEHQVLAWVKDNDNNGAQTVGEFREQLAQRMKALDLIEPEELWAFAYNLPYLVELTWASSGEIGYYDVCFTRYTVPTETVFHTPARIHRTTQMNKRKAWQEYANNPLQAQQKRQLIPQLRHYLQQSLPDYMVPALFMTLDALPLTPNGKVNRRALPKPDLSRSDLADATAPRNTIETQLAEIWTEVLGVAQVGIHDNFFELGGDSILNIRILAKANQAGLRLTPKQLWQQQTIADLAKVARLSPSIQAEQGIVTGSVPLTAYHHWFFEQEFADAHHWNMPLLFEVHVPMRREWLKETIDALLSHHDALRMRFTHTASGWHAFIINQDLAHPSLQNENQSFLWVDLSALPAKEQKTVMQQRAGELQASLDLSDGPLVKVAYFDMGAEQADYLLFIIHHLVVDGVSWLILLEDFQTAYQQLAEDKAIKLPRKSTSFKKWASYPLDYVQSGALEQEVGYWLAITNSSDDFRGRGSSPGTTTFDDNLVSSSHIITQTLTTHETEQLLREVPTAYNTQINDVLLTALLLAYHKWSGNGSLLIDLEGHGREEITQEVDLSRTVSGFTTIFPVHLKLTDDPDDLGGVLMAMKEQLRVIPQHGIGYGLLRYLHPDKQVREQLRLDTPAPLIFNYLGQFDQILPDAASFTLSREAHGPIYSPRGKRTHLIEVNSFVADGQLHLEWTYSQAYHQQQTIQQFAEQFMQRLRALITHCQAPENARSLVEIYPEAGLNQEQLEELLRELGEL